MSASGVPVPRYDYRCEAGHQYERQEPFRSPVAHPCERCGKTARRLLVAPPLVFKSGGFYKTSGRSDSGSAESEGTKGVRSKTPPKKSADAPVPSAAPATPSAAADD